MTKAKNLVAVGDEIAAELGIPIVNKRVSVTPIALIGAATDATDYLPWLMPWTRRLMRSALILSEAFQLWFKGLPKGMKSSSTPYRRHWPKRQKSARRLTSARPRRVST